MCAAHRANLNIRGRLAEQLHQHIAVAPLGRTPTAQAFAAQLLERAHQLGLSNQPFAIHTYDSLSFGIGIVPQDERVPPFAGADTALGHGSPDVDIKVIMQIVDHGRLCHLPTLSRITV